MALGRLSKEPQFTMADIGGWREKVEQRAAKFWCALWAFAKKFIDEDLFQELFSSIGRPSISPVLTFVAFLIQLHTGWSDRQLEEQSFLNDGVKYALGVERDFTGIDAVTLSRHRALFIKDGFYLKLFEAVLQPAKEEGYLSGQTLSVIDSFMIAGAGAQHDTYTLIRKTIKMVLRIAVINGVETEMRSVLRRDDYDKSGKPEIDWKDEAAKQQLLESLVKDALALVEKGKELSAEYEDLAAVLDLLQRVATQDVDIDDTGRVTMHKGTAKDRIVSLTDVEMRHGRKTSSQKGNGYKGTILTGGRDGRFIIGVEVEAANVPDKAATDAILEYQDEEERRPEKVLGDCAFADPELKERQEEKGTILETDMPFIGGRDGKFGKDDFQIDTEAGTVTCPAGVEVEFDPGLIEEHRETTVCFGENCKNCPRREQCTASEKGRTIHIHAWEREMQRDREKSKTPEFKEKYRQRAKGEHEVQRIVRAGARHARFIGTTKVKMQATFAAMVVNIKAFMYYSKGGVCPNTG